MAKLKNDKHEMFCQEYLKDLNATEAYIRAGYDKKSANANGNRLIVNDSVAARIAELKAVRVERVEVEADDIVKQLDEYRRSNIADYVELTTTEETVVTKDGVSSTGKVQRLKFKDFADLTDEQLRCIESIKQGKNGIELKLHGTEWSVEKLNRHIGFYGKDHDQASKVVIESNEDRISRIAALKLKLGTE